MKRLNKDIKSGEKAAYLIREYFNTPYWKAVLEKNNNGKYKYTKYIKS